MARPKRMQLDRQDVEALHDKYERLRELLDDHVSKFAEEHEVSPGALALLLIDLGVTSKMIDYLISAEKPSGSGLKLDLDRLQREVDHFIRDFRRNADDFMRDSGALIRDYRAEVETVLEAEAQEQAGKR